MNTSKEFLFFFGALGAFNGLLLSGYFLFLTKKKQLSTLFFGALLLAMSIRIGKSIFASLDHSLPKIYLQIGLTACFFIGPFLYYFLKSTLYQMVSFPKSWKWSLGLLFAVILIPGFFFSYENYPKLWNNYFVQVIYAEWFVYMVASGFVIKSILKKSLERGVKMKTSEIWLLTVFGGVVLIYSIFQLALWNASFSLYIKGSFIFSFTLYLVIFILLYRKKADDLFNTGQVKSSNKKLNPEDADILLARLEKIMTENELYRNADLKLNDLAVATNVSNHQLSQLINDHLDKNFTTYINEFRIDAACSILVSDRRLTLESVGYDVGFNSKSTFFATFKKLKGVTPATYQQNMLSDMAYSTDL